MLPRAIRLCRPAPTLIGLRIDLAGAVGIEPTMSVLETDALATWRHPYELAPVVGIEPTSSALTVRSSTLNVDRNGADGRDRTDDKRFGKPLLCL